MEILILILSLMTIPFIVYQTVIIENLEDEIKQQMELLEHNEKIIKAYENQAEYYKKMMEE